MLLAWKSTHLKPNPEVKTKIVVFYPMVKYSSFLEFNPGYNNILDIEAYSLVMTALQ
jgi:hypothetical protein